MSAHEAVDHALGFPEVNLVAGEGEFRGINPPVVADGIQLSGMDPSGRKPTVIRCEHRPGVRILGVHVAR